MAKLLEEELAREMARWEAAGLRRELGSSYLGSAQAGRVDFASNDYLGLAHHPAVIESATRALSEAGAGGRASRLLGGGGAIHERAEAEAATWLGAEAALLFASGYQANLGLVSALVGRSDVILSDELNHASLIDAARLSRARILVYRHGDLAELERLLGSVRGAHRRLVLTEGVFSMEGDRPDLVALAELCRKHDAWLAVDEAHAAGLLGDEGRGACVEAGLTRENAPNLVARVVTGGKALGAGGAFVVGTRVVRDHLINRARAFIYTTAPTPALPGALCAAIELCRAAEDERRRVRELASLLAREVGAGPPAAAIVPCVVGSGAHALELAQGLDRKGIDARAVRPPTVPEGTARLRLTCHAYNQPAEVDELARHLAEQRTPAEPLRVSTASAASRRPLFVVGTDTGIGKTVVSALLLRTARTIGPSAYWKPVQTGDESDTETVRELSEAAAHELLRPAWSLELPASPHEAAAAADVRLEPQRLEEGLAALQRMLPEAHLIVELAGGLLVPYHANDGGYTQADWLARRAPDVVLVARSGLGTLNHTLLTLEALRARHLEPRALFLIGPPHESNRETLRQLGRIETILEVPLFEALEPEALERWLGENELAFLFQS